MFFSGYMTLVLFIQSVVVRVSLIYSICVCVCAHACACLQFFLCRYVVCDISQVVELFSAPIDLSNSNFIG